MPDIFLLCDPALVLSPGMNKNTLEFLSSVLIKTALAVNISPHISQAICCKA